MHARLVTVAATFRSNTMLFRGTLDAVREAEWLHRPGEANHIAFLATHLVGARHFIVGRLGGTSVDPLEAYHGRARSIDDMERFPVVEETLQAWNEVSPLLIDALGTIGDPFLDEDHGLPFPTPGPTRLDELVFLAQHEAYHLGQMGLLRRIVGLPAASWG